jgi:hypothetical protein
MPAWRVRLPRRLRAIPVLSRCACRSSQRSIGVCSRPGTFRLVAIVLLATALLIGTLTQVRVHNVAMEDMMYVLAMNRLRGEYAALAPGVAGAFLSSPHDD